MEKNDVKTINDLTQHWGWKIITEELNKTIQNIEDDLLSINPVSNKVQYTEHDILRILRKELLLYRDLPSKLVKWFDTIENNIN